MNYSNSMFFSSKLGTLVLAVALLTRRGLGPAEFRQFHPGGRLGARLRRARSMRCSARRPEPVVPGDATATSMSAIA